MNPLDPIMQRAISPASVHVVGPLTVPRSYGVYRLPPGAPGRRYRFGNHPVRMQELQREFGTCALECLFAQRADARETAHRLSATRG